MFAGGWQSISNQQPVYGSFGDANPPLPEGQEPTIPQPPLPDDLPEEPLPLPDASEPQFEYSAVVQQARSQVFWGGSSDGQRAVRSFV